MPKTINEWSKYFDELVKQQTSSDACLIQSIKNAHVKLYSEDEVKELLSQSSENIGGLKNE